MDPAAFQRIYNGGAATYKCTTAVRGPFRYRCLHTYTYTYSGVESPILGSSFPLF